jgi:hypothetical protein
VLLWFLILPRSWLLPLSEVYWQTTSLWNLWAPIKSKEEPVSRFFASDPPKCRLVILILDKRHKKGEQSSSTFGHTTTSQSSFWLQMTLLSSLKWRIISSELLSSRATSKMKFLQTSYLNKQKYGFCYILESLNGWSNWWISEKYSVCCGVLFCGLTRALFSKVDGHVNILSWADWTFEMSCYGLFSILRSFRINQWNSKCVLAYGLFLADSPIACTVNSDRNMRNHATFFLFNHAIRVHFCTITHFIVESILKIYCLENYFGCSFLIYLVLLRPYLTGDILCNMFWHFLQPRLEATHFTANANVVYTGRVVSICA